MQMCSRCHKRIAVVFISHIENNKPVNEGICIRCAKELGIKPVSDMINNMGLSEEDLDRMDMEMEGLIEAGAGDTDGESDGESESRTPPIDMTKLFPKGFVPGFNAPEPPDGFGEDGVKTDRKREKVKEPKRKFLEMYCMDLTGKAREGKLDRIVGRDKELARLTQILCRRQKNNPCLIGEPGVGKTAIAEALASKIVEGNVPYKLRDKEVMVVDLTALVAGTQFRGQFESRMKGLIEEVKSFGNIILVIDEVHSIVGAGDAEGSMNAANILKPALSRGDVQVIGATTLKEYRKYIEKDSALERRFQPIIVEEPSVDDTMKILLGIKKYYEDYHGIKIPDEVARRAVSLSERYITDRFLPDKAIDLLDESSAYLALHSPVIGQSQEASSRLDAIRARREKTESDMNSEADEKKRNEGYQLIADLKVEELNLERSAALLRIEADKVTLSLDDLAQVIEIWTGIPASNISEHEFRRIDKLEERIRKRIIGQDEAVSAVARAIKRSRAGISYKKKPVSFIFAGPTGVGKTELVKVLAADLFDSPETLIRLDMSEFMEKHSVSRIIGAPPGYVGYDEAGQLTEKIRRKPYSVVLFDEIEKAHPDVLNVLLQILDDGRITDAQGVTVSFENTVIVMTTNAGSDNSTATAGFAGSEAQVTSEKTLKALSDFLRPEFLNRIDEVITFNPLTAENFTHIARIMLNDLKGAMEDRGVNFIYTDAAADYIAEKSFSRKFGARNMRRYIQTEVEDAVANIIISSYDRDIRNISIDKNPAEDKLSFICT